MRRFNLIILRSHLKRMNRIKHNTKPIRYAKVMPQRGRFPFQRFERKLIRIMVILTVLLGLFQFRTFADPVAFYLKLSGELDTPAFKYDENQASTIMLTFRISPQAEVVLRQNDTNLGSIADNKSVQVQPGTVYLDATAVPYPVTIDIIHNRQHYSMQLEGDVKSFEVKLNSAEAI